MTTLTLQIDDSLANQIKAYAHLNGLNIHEITSQFYKQVLSYDSVELSSQLIQSGANQDNTTLDNISELDKIFGRYGNTNTNISNNPTQPLSVEKMNQDITHRLQQKWLQG